MNRNRGDQEFAPVYICPGVPSKKGNKCSFSFIFALSPLLSCRDGAIEIRGKPIFASKLFELIYQRNKYLYTRVPQQEYVCVIGAIFRHLAIKIFADNKKMTCHSKESFYYMFEGERNVSRPSERSLFDKMINTYLPQTEHASWLDSANGKVKILSTTISISTYIK